MNHTIKRCLAVVMAALMMLTAIPLYALEAEPDINLIDEPIGTLYSSGDYVISAGVDTEDRGDVVATYDLSSAMTNGINGEARIKRVVILDEFTPDDCKEYFADAENLTEITGLNLMKTSNISSFEGMFSNDKALTYVDLTGLDLGNLTDTSKMFYNCSSLLTASFDYLGSVVVADMMFYGCASMANRDASFLPVTASQVGIFDGIEINLTDDAGENDITLTDSNVYDTNIENVNGIENLTNDFNGINNNENLAENLLDENLVENNTENNNEEIVENIVDNNEENKGEDENEDLTENQPENSNENSDEADNANSSVEDVDIVEEDNEIQKTDVTIFCEWKDSDVFRRPLMVSYRILANGDEYEIVTLTYEDVYEGSENIWTKTFSLPMMDENGQEIVYTAEQDAFDRYDTSGGVIENGYAYFTNTEKAPEKKKLLLKNNRNLTNANPEDVTRATIEIEWWDGWWSGDAERPTELNVRAYALTPDVDIYDADLVASHPYDTVTLTSEDSIDGFHWRKTVDLPKRNANGNVIFYYFVQETPVGFISCDELSKIYGLSFDENPNYGNDTEVFGYFTNCQATEHTVDVVWRDNHNSKQCRPNELDVEIRGYDDTRSEDDGIFDYSFTKTISANDVTEDADTWRTTVKLPAYSIPALYNAAESHSVKLHLYSCGDEAYSYYYHLTHPDTIYGFTVNTEDNYTRIFAEAVPETTEFFVSVIWDDENDSRGDRPQTVTLQLLANGEPYNDAVDVTNENRVYHDEYGDEEHDWDYHFPFPTGYEETVTDNEWRYLFAHLPKYDADGNEITYTVEMENGTNSDYEQSYVDMYDDSDTPVFKGQYIINKYNATTPTPTIHVQGKKTWDDNDNEEGIRPDEITVILKETERHLEKNDDDEWVWSDYSEPTEIARKVVTADDNWEYDFGEFICKDKGDNDIQYIIEEEPVKGYITTYNGFDIINKTAKKSYRITKNWFNDNEDVRPDSITVHIYDKSTGEELCEPITLTSDNAQEIIEDEFYSDETAIWSVETPEIESYVLDDDGYVVKTKFGNYKEKDIIVEEDPISGYETGIYTNKIHVPGSETTDESGLPTWTEYIVKGWTINNTYMTQEKNSIPIVKRWVGDEAENRPESITLHVLDKNTREELCEPFVITDKNSHEETAEGYEGVYWEGQSPEYDVYVVDENGNFVLDEAGRRIYHEWVIEEDPVPGYTMTDITQFMKCTMLITNTYTPDPVEETVTIEGEKTWDDNNDADKVRPEKITVRLFNGDNEVASKEVTAENEWKYSFADLPKYDSDSKEISYTIKEDEVEGYKVTYEGYNITNTLEKKEAETVEIKGTKTWNDADNKDGLRPETLTIYLYANEKEIASIETNEEKEWKYDFGKLDKFDEDGNEIKYDLMEDKVEGYEAEFDGWNITNTHVPADEAISVKGHKVWEDVDNELGLRPDSIVVRLYADGKEIDHKKVTEADNWAFVFTDLPKQKDNKDITYTISEDEVKGYTTTINGYVIINTLHVDKSKGSEKDIISINGQKNWDDDNNKDGIRPSYITVRLFADGQEIANTKATVTNNWTFSFTNLPRSKDGKIIEYTIDEDNVSGYTKQINGYSITNTHKTAAVNTTIDNSTSQQKDNTVNTGDTQNIMLMIGLMLAALFCLVIIKKPKTE